MPPSSASSGSTKRSRCPNPAGSVPGASRKTTKASTKSASAVSLKAAWAK